MKTPTLSRAFKTFQTKGCKHYCLLNELFSASTTTGALCISLTNRPRTSDEERQLHKKFPSTSKKKHKQHVNLEEGSGESDDSSRFKSLLYLSPNVECIKDLHRQAHNCISA
ncbi:hypothetical protein CDL15_Pgr018962 [Punica granatum]|uniref:Uncharacterized protein n=1 Tax=Punica granatum TaxID=22663 RepID=A0A218WPH7_PUNGR|nr:hypothetical protein CDL15_Pgr018962 [Punica granatum]